MGDHHCASSGGVKVPKKAKIKTLKTTKKSGKVMQPQNKSEKFVAKSIKKHEITENKTAGINLILRPGTDPGTENFEGNVKDMSSSHVNGTCLASTQSLDTKTFCEENPGNASKVCESEIPPCTGRQVSHSRAQTTSVKSRIPLGLTRRRKHIARRKSFLKKGDVGLSTKRRFSKELEVKASSAGENTQEKKTVVDGEPSTKPKPSFLYLTKKTDPANSTFVKSKNFKININLYPIKTYIYIYIYNHASSLFSDDFEKKCFKKPFTKDFR